MRRLLSVCILLFLLSLPVYAAGGKVTDEQVKAVRALFEEDTSDPSKQGLPGEKFRGKSLAELESIIDLQFASKLYKMPNALAAISRVFSGREYAAINQRLGDIRNRLNIQIWAEIAAKYGIRIELNDAGKKGGAVSDLDKFHFTDAVRLDGKEIPPEKIHAFLIAEHEKLWRQKTNGTKPIDFDSMHFPGDGLMADWRMSNSHWQEFSHKLAKNIATLGTTEGAYFIPGAYKTQVYTRYHLEGKSQIFYPTSEDPASLPNFLEEMVDDLPPGVYVSKDVPTKDFSKLYKDIPFDIDRTGALGSALQNYLAAVDTVDTIKNSKYNNRWGDTSLAHLTNLEVDFRRLILEGKTDILRYHLDKLFAKDLKSEVLPPSMQDLDEVQRVIELLNQIEIDKTIKQYKGKTKPKSWSSKWQNYDSANINDTKVKLRYFKKEVDEIRKSFSAEDMPSDEKIAQLAEQSFRQKAHAVGRLAVVTAAKNVFRDVFTREGFSRQKHLYGEDAAKRLLVERAKEIHAAFIFADDKNLINSILREVPAEARKALMMIADIAESQRKLVLEHKSVIDSIPEEWASLRENETTQLRRRLEKNLNQSDRAIRALMRDLGLDPDTVKGGPGVVRLRLGDLQFEYARQEVALTMRDRLAKYLREGKIRTTQGVQESLQKLDQFFNVDVHKQMTSKAFFSEYYNSFFDIGTVDSAGKIFTAWATGKKDAMIQEARDSVLSNMPYGGKAYSLVKSLKDLEKGKSAPTLLFLTQTFLGHTAHGAKYGALIGMLNALYGLEQSLFQLGWHFYGKPTQEAAVSLILMGDLSAFHGDSNAVRLPVFRDPDTSKLLSQNAILMNKVRVPRYPKAFRNKFLRAHFLVDANRAATALGNSAPGQFSTWEEDRNRTLAQKYYRNWKYWLRRIFFYQKIHNRFSRWAGHLSGDSNWQRYDKTGPGFMSSLPKAEQMNVYGAAFDRKVGATGSWDHEIAWLVRYFYSWVQEWEQAQKQHGELLYYLDSVGLAGGWRKAVVDALVAMYREGEVIEHRQWEAQLQSKIDERKNKQKILGELKAARERMEKAGKHGYQAVGRHILETHGKKRLETFLQMEELKWHPDILKAIESGLLQAARKQKDYKPKDPKLTVIVPRPVGKMGQEIPAEIHIRGDSKNFPDDLQLEVSFQPVRTYEGQRPSEVLEDDIIALYRDNIEEEKLLIVEHKATYKVSSASNPDFNVEEDKNIFWIDILKEDEENKDPEESTLGEDTSTGPTIDLSEMQRLARLAKESENQAEAFCKQAATYADKVNSVKEDLQELLTKFQEKTKELRSLMTKLEALLIELPPLPDKVLLAGEKLAKWRDQSADSSQATCLLKDKLADVKTPDQQDQVWGDIQASHKLVREAYTEGLKEYLKLKRDWKKIETAKSLLASIQSVYSALEVEQERFNSLAESARNSLIQGEENNLSAEVQVTSIEDKQNQGSQILAEAEETLKNNTDPEQAALLDQMRGLYGQIVNSNNAVKACPDETKVKLQKATNGLKLVTDKFKSDLPAKLSAESVNLVQDAYNKTEATAALADPFWKSIEARLKRSEKCLQEARALLRQIVSIPALVGVKAAEAVQAIEKLKLAPVTLGGNSARTKAEEFTVFKQQPTPGVRVFVKTPLSIHVYGKYKSGEAEVSFIRTPNVRGFTRAEAVNALKQAGFKVGYRIEGKPRSKAEENRVRKQVPFANSKQKRGAEAFIWVYERYEAPVEQEPVVTSDPSQPFYVALKAYFPEIKKKSASGKYKDVLRSMTLSNVRFVHEPDRTFILAVNGEGLKYYKKSFFQPGAAYATNMALKGRDPKTGQSFNISGAFLFKVAYIFDSTQPIYTRYPKARDRKSLTGNFMSAKHQRGLFVQNLSSDQGSFNISGGPLVKGWSTAMKQKNLAFMKKIAEMFDCFVATVVYDSDVRARQLWILRNFRDRVLLQHVAGRNLVSYYYDYGPYLAYQVLEYPDSKSYIRLFLDPFTKYIELLDHEQLASSIRISMALTVVDSITKHIVIDKKDRSSQVFNDH